MSSPSKGGLTTSRSLLLLAAGLVAALAVAPPASASELVARDATNVRLKVDAQGRAIVFYNQGGRSFHPMFWGATNARHPTPGVRQLEFRKDYSGGWGTYREPLWKTIENVCRPYDGPKLPWFVTGCAAPDGSYWALQAWQRMLPNLGIAPWQARQSARELHLSHWTGELPKLQVWLDWSYSGRFHHLFGRLTYRGKPVFGFDATSKGAPLDGYGRNVYLDTRNSAYGPGWKRENSFLTHRPNGNFCYGFYPHDPYAGYPPVGRRPPGNGDRYRITVMGPGVTPIVMWEGAALPGYDPHNRAHVEHESRMNALGKQIAHGDQSRTPCRGR